MATKRQRPWRKTLNKKTGKYQYRYSYESVVWNLPRVRKVFNTLEECKAFHRKRLKEAMNPENKKAKVILFKEAINKYVEENKNKLSLIHTLSNLRCLAWPYRSEGKWRSMMDAKLDDQANGITNAIQEYVQDLENVVKRSFIDGRIFHKRKENEELVWFEQPISKADYTCSPRFQVTDKELISKLEETNGKAGFTKNTLNSRIVTVKTILNQCYKKYRWIDVKLSDFIMKVKPEQKKLNIITKPEVDRIIANSDEYFSYLIKGAVLIGWRQANLIGLTWDRVHFPEVIENEYGEPVAMCGYLSVDGRKTAAEIDTFDLKERRIRTKNGEALDTTMSKECEALLRHMLTKKHPKSNLVFHKGNGLAWGDFRARWKAAQEKANINRHIRWHDLRHHWATELINKGVSRDVIKAEQGWKCDATVERYSKLGLNARHQIIAQQEERQGL